MTHPPIKSTSKDLVPVPEKQRLLPIVKSRADLIPTDPLNRYLIEVSRYPILSPEEEKEIAEHYQKHQDKESAQKLVLANLRLVVKIAIEYRSAYYNILDLIQEGNLGLLRAVQKYDVDRGVRFTSYAAWWVRAYILKFILDNFRLVRIGTTQAQKKLFFNLIQEKEKIEKMGIAATSEMISKKLDVKEHEVIEMQKRLGNREMELDAPRKNFEGALNMDFISTEDKKADEQVETSELKEILLTNLKEFTASLSEKERNIFSKRLFNEVPKTLQEIADQYGITRERIRQIENRVITKMRTYFATKGLTLEIEKKIDLPEKFPEKTDSKK
ncbi:MAG: RNA polymerase factor sigma-32 [Deltaproteobacteria bacterium]|nr:RNA polymerase factor sigma-32 [Deltaproteobacteria bacterium]